MTNGYVLGLDLGISSIGWAVAPQSELGDIADIESMGSFCYPSPIAEVEKGRRISNRVGRGAKRRSRHRLDHFQARRKKLVRLLVHLGWWPNDKTTQENLRHAKLREEAGRITLVHPIALKVKGLEEPLSEHDLGKVMLHYQRHRGYLSTADLPVLLAHLRPKNTAAVIEVAEAPGLQTSEQKEALDFNKSMVFTQKKMQGRTVSQFQLDELENLRAVRARLSPTSLELRLMPKEQRDERSKKRTTRTSERYQRWMFIEEFDLLWAKQAETRPEMTEELMREIRSLVFHQAPLKEKSRDVGFCELLPKQRRCRTGELVFQRSRILQTLANLDVLENGEPRRLTSEERTKALAYLMVRDKSTLKALREYMELTNARFKAEPPEDEPEKGKAKKKKTASAAVTESIKGSAFGAKLAKILGVTGEALADGSMDDLVHDFISIPTADKLFARLTSTYGLEPDAATELMALEPPKGYGKLCARLLRRIEPKLKEGMDLHNAVIEAGYKWPHMQEAPEPAEKLVIDREWTTGNPSVNAAVRWSAKVVNQIIDRYGKPKVIRIELPRQMAMGNEARAQEFERINKRAKENEQYAKELEEAGIEPRMKYIKMVRLWNESDRRSPYAPSQEIASLKDLIEHYDLDHIVPQSHAAEDGMDNLVICPRSLNQEKGAKTPWEAFGHTTRWAEIEQFLAANRSISPRKKQRIMAKERPEMAMEARMLAATGYIGRQITSLLRTLGKEVAIELVNGQITAEARRRYGIDSVLDEEKSTKKGIGKNDKFSGEKDRSDLRHHAVDAAVIVAVNRSLAGRLRQYYKDLENWKKYRKVEGEAPTVTLEEPFANYRNRVLELLPGCPVVRPANRKISGPLHKETMLPLNEFKNVTGPPNTFQVIGQNVIRFGEEGEVTGAWVKSTVHHGLIFETLSGKRRVESVSLFEAAKRVSENNRARKRGEKPVPIVRPVERRFTGLERCVMSISNGDTVEYTGDKGAGPGFYRVGTIAVGNSTEISLIWCRDAKSDPKAPKSVRATGQADFKNIAARVVQNIFGEVIFREPGAADD